MFVFLFLVKPTTVSILDKISHVSADKEVEVTCEAIGGYPSPKLTWWLGSKILRAFDEVSYNLLISYFFPTQYIVENIY